MRRANQSSLAVSLAVAAALLGGLVGYHLRAGRADAQDAAGRWQAELVEESDPRAAILLGNAFLATLDPACLVTTSAEGPTRTGTFVFVVTYRC